MKVGKLSRFLVQQERMKNFRWQSIIEKALDTITYVFGSLKTLGLYGVVAVNTGQKGLISFS